jgi:hypothetical protein
VIRRARRLLGKLAGATPTATRVEELRPLSWSVVDDHGNRWLLVRSEYSRGPDGGTVVLTLRDETTLRAPRIVS